MSGSARQWIHLVSKPFLPERQTHIKGRQHLASSHQSTSARRLSLWAQLTQRKRVEEMRSLLTTYALLLLTLLQGHSVESCCPNQCSGRGICTTLGNGCICSCFKGYAGGDCSRRTCCLRLLLPCKGIGYSHELRTNAYTPQAHVRWDPRGATSRWRQTARTCPPCARTAARVTITLGNAPATLASRVSPAIAVSIDIAILVDHGSKL